VRDPTPEIRDLARRLLAQEVGARPGPLAWAEAAERACEKLRQRIALLVGPAGFHALLARALQLAGAEFPFLQGVRAELGAVGAQHAAPLLPLLPGLRDAVAGRDGAEAGAALGAVLAHFIWLLVTFIGADLGLRLVRDVWPEPLPGARGAGTEEAKQ